MAANSSALRPSPLLAAALAATAACFFLCCSASRAQAPAPSGSGGLDCTQSFFNMSGCLSFVVAGSNDTKPDKECCGELAGMFDSNPICLCQLLSGSAAESLGISIDYDKALKLPSICHVDSLPVSLCSDIGIPVASPTGKHHSPSSAISASPSPTASGPQIPGMTPESPPAPSAATAGYAAVGLPAVAAALSLVVAAAAAGVF